MKDSFLFYKSFYDSILEMPEEYRLAVFDALCACAFGMKTVDDLTFPVKPLVMQMLVSITKAEERYNAAVENGNRGGRPSKQDFIPPSVWIGAIEEHGSVPKAAKALGLAANTLRNWINMSNDPRVQKLKNLNDNVSDNVSVSVSVSDNVNDSDTENRKYLKKTPDTTTTDPNGSPSRPTKKKELSFEEMWRPPD